MKIPPRVREEAALICAIAASTPDLHDAYRAVCDALGIDRDGGSMSLALDAWDAARPYSWSGGERDAEAEALLRTGWSP